MTMKSTRPLKNFIGEKANTQTQQKNAKTDGQWYLEKRNVTRKRGYTVNQRVLTIVKTLHTIVVFFRICKIPNKQMWQWYTGSFERIVQDLSFEFYYDVVFWICFKVLKALIYHLTRMKLSLETCCLCSVSKRPGRELPTNVCQGIHTWVHCINKYHDWWWNSHSVALSCRHSANEQNSHSWEVGAVMKQLCTIALGSTTTLHVTSTLL